MDPEYGISIDSSRNMRTKPRELNFEQRSCLSHWDKFLGVTLRLESILSTVDKLDVSSRLNYLPDPHLKSSYVGFNWHQHMFQNSL